MSFVVALIGAVFIGGLVAWGSEFLALTRNGLIPSIIIGVGGAVIAYLLLALTGLGLGGRALTSALGAAIALFLTPRLGPR